MEHLSRKTTEDVDALLLVSNHSVKGIRAIGRILELVDELKKRLKASIRPATKLISVLGITTAMAKDPSMKIAKVIKAASRMARG